MEGIERYAGLSEREIEARAVRAAAKRFREKISNWEVISPGLQTIKETLLTDGVDVILGEYK